MFEQIAPIFRVDNAVVEKERTHEPEKRKITIIAIFIVWLISDMIALGFQILVPIELRIIICEIWIAELLILFCLLAILGGRNIALGAAYLLLVRIFIPILLITMYLPLPNPMLTNFQIISLIPIGIIILSILSWKLASHFSDPQMMEGIGVMGIFMGVLWLIVFVILFFYLSTI